MTGKIATSIVRISKSVGTSEEDIRNGSDEPAGTGIVLDRYHVLTPAHVVNTAVGADQNATNPPIVELLLTVPIREGGAHQVYRARVMTDLWRPVAKKPEYGIADDVAVLELTSPPRFHSDVTSAQLSAMDITDATNVAVVMSGFPDIGYSDTVSGRILKVNSEGRIQIELDDKERRLTHGFSGAQVEMYEADCSVGMVVLKRDKKVSGRGGDLNRKDPRTVNIGFATPFSTLVSELNLAERLGINIPGKTPDGPRKDAQVKAFEKLIPSQHGADFGGWPVTLGMVAGLDRTRQVVLCASSDRESIVNELNRAEAELKASGNCAGFGDRTWVFVDPRAEGVLPPNAVYDITSYSDGFSAVQDLAIEHFRSSAHVFGASALFLLSPDQQEVMADLASELTAAAEEDDSGFSVAALVPWSQDRIMDRLTPYQKKIVEHEMLTSATTQNRHSAERSLAVQIKQQVSQGEFDRNDVWLGALAGHFGTFETVIRGSKPGRLVSLIRAMEDDDMLREAIFILPVCREIVGALCEASIDIRAVVGLVTEAECREYPPPWFNTPLSVRAGRKLIVPGTTSGT